MTMAENPAAAAPQTTTFNILYVCTGNTCRSPLAEALTRAAVERRGWRHVEVRSAGVAARDGDPASEFSVTVAERRGLPLQGHRSRAVSPELIDWADVVLAMSPSHLDTVDSLGGARKASLLADFAAGRDDAGLSVPDPFGGDLGMYETTIEELERLVARVLDRLAPILQP
jgi:protein-tyrosine-phosphatase